MDNKIIIKTDKELKIIMSPIRQKIIKLLSTEGKPVTSKYIADKLEISPSSAAHHIKQLESLKIIEFDHSEIINGITAKFIKLTERTISIGQGLNDNLNEERDLLVRTMLLETYEGFQSTIRTMSPVIIEEFNKGNKFADVLNGVAHLTQDEANEFYNIIDDFIKNHSKAAEGTHPFEYALVAYRKDLV